MSMTPMNRHHTRALASLGLAAILVGSVPRPGAGFEPYHPANEGLRNVIRDATMRQTVRRSADLERRVRDALRWIDGVDSRSDAATAARLASALRMTWQEVERARTVGALGYREFDDAKFEAAESKLEQIAAELGGPRAPLPAAEAQAAGQALADVQALSRAARSAVPGLSSDDVLLMRAKRHRLLNASPQGYEAGGAPAMNAGETAVAPR